MNRLISKLVFVLPLVWFALPASAKAQDAACWYNWGVANDNQGEYAKAIADYNQAIALCPDYSAAYNNRGYDFSELGNQTQAIADYNTALVYDPNSSTAYNNRGFSYYTLGNYDQAIADYNQALAICPTYAAAYSNRGVVWADKGETDKARADYDQALAVDPNIAAAYSNRGVIESSNGQYEQAKADFYRALSVDPNYTTGYENLAFFLATCPDPKYRDGKKAFDNASHAYQMAGDANGFYTANALAAAYAECGDFASARQWQQKTIQLAPAEDKQMETTRLALYVANKPYRSQVTKQ